MVNLCRRRAPAEQSQRRDGTEFGKLPLVGTGKKPGVSRAETSLRIVQLCLKGREPKEGDNHHPEDNLDKFLLRALALSTYFFRDLTTLVVTGYLEVPHAFLIGLLGPSSRNRSIIKDLTLLPKWRSYVHRILFEALDRIEWLAQDTSFIDLIPRDESHATLRDELEEHVRAIGPAGGSWEPLNAAAVRLARSDPRYFQFMTPAAFSHVETLPEILETLDKPCHPFSSLRSLSFESDDGLDLYPVLYSRLFPALRDLSLSGRLDFRWPEDVTVAEMAPAVAHDIKLLRHSVTK